MQYIRTLNKFNLIMVSLSSYKIVGNIEILDICYFLLFISSICKSNCDRVPTNNFLQVFGDERLSLDEDRLIELSLSNDNECLITGLSSLVETVFTLVFAGTLSTTSIFTFFRSFLLYSSYSSRSFSNFSWPDPSYNTPPLVPTY